MIRKKYIKNLIEEKIIAVIPARGGSKSIKKKNIRKLSGKPLIHYSIKEALKLKNSFYKIIVSTDDKKIAKISKKEGAIVPFIRPKSLSNDFSPTLPVIKHAVRFIEKEDNVIIDWVLILQPTSPLRSVTDIKNCISIIKKNKNIDSVVSVKRVVNSHPYFLKLIKNGFLKSYIKNFKFSRRQSVKPDLYKTNGSIYLTKKNIIFKNKNNLVYGKKSIPYLMDEKKSIDIDTDIDFKLCEVILNERK